MTSEEFHAGGVELVKRHLKKLKGRPVYLTLDIDVVDPAFAPGTGDAASRRTFERADSRSGALP